MDDTLNGMDDDLLPALVGSLETVLFELGQMERAISNAPRHILNGAVLREIVRRRAILHQDADALFSLVCDSRLEDPSN